MMMERREHRLGLRVMAADALAADALAVGASGASTAPGRDPRHFRRQGEDVARAAREESSVVSRRTADTAARTLDVAIAATALLLLAPIILIVALAIRLDSKGAVIFRQCRVGKDRRRRNQGRDAPNRRSSDLGGRPFTIYKFRTMRCEAERTTGPVWAAPDDHRATRVGGWLRRSHFDELPQLANVLKGDMALVGPRPERPEIVRWLRRSVPGYPERHRVLPGITGWAQVNCAPDRVAHDVVVKLGYDIEYIERRSLAFDIRILARTLPVLLWGPANDRRPRPDRAEPPAASAVVGEDRAFSSNAREGGRASGARHIGGRRPRPWRVFGGDERQTPPEGATAGRDGDDGDSRLEATGAGAV